MFNVKKKKMLPNIVLIVLDSVRPDHMSCYGYSKRTTPNLENLAQNGAQFLNCIANSSWTIPSHVSLLTGLYPPEHGIYDFTNSLPYSGSIQTLASILKQAGYQCIGLSSNHLISLVGLNMGFDKFLELGSSVNIRTIPQYLKKTLWRFKMLLLRDDNGGMQINCNFHEFLKDRTHHQPFFFFINYMEAHHPWIPRYPVCKPLGTEGYYKTLKKALNIRSFHKSELDLNSSITRSEINAMIELYDQSIFYVDHLVGQVIQMLEEQGLLDCTLVIVTSDHGENFGEHQINGLNIFGHLFSVHDSLVCVPLILFWPRAIASKQVVQLVQLSDVGPTLENLLGLQNKEINNTCNLMRVDILNDHKLKQRKYAFVDYAPTKYSKAHLMASMAHLGDEQVCAHLHTKLSKRLIAVRSRDFKLINRGGVNVELIDLRIDPLERENLFDRSVYTEVQLEMETALTSWLSEAKKASAVHEMSERSLNEKEAKEVERRLRDIGYL